MRVLLVGNTGYITKEFVQEAFPESEVFIMGNSLLKTERKKHLNVRPFPERDEELEDIFRTYDFALMILNLWFIFLIILHFMERWKVKQRSFEKC